MRYKPYQEIMDFDKERKEYLNLCKNKSKKYTYYTDWEKHITKCVSTISKERDLYNFKHYCIRRARATAKMPEIFAAYSTLLLTICFNKFDSIWSCALTILLALGVIIFAMHQHKIAIYESHFFSDLIGMIKKIEKITIKQEVQDA